MKYFALFVLSIVLSVCVVGCNGTAKVTKNLQDSKTQASTALEHLDEIDRSASNINTLTDDPSVHDETKNIDKHTDDATKNIVALNKNNEKLGKDLLAERESSLKKYKAYLVTISVISGIGIFVAGGLALSGTLRNFKLMIIAACVFCGSISLLFLFQYLLYVAIITAVIVVGLIIYGITTNGAMKQTWKAIEQARKDGVISWEEWSAIADATQSKTTKSLIDAWQKKVDTNKEP